MLGAVDLVFEVFLLEREGLFIYLLTLFYLQFHPSFDDIQIK
jgi:hypothetical protein